MAFSMSNRAFEEVFGSGSLSPKGKSGDIYGILKKYLKGKKNPSAVLLRRWMGNGGLLCAFTCRADVVLPLLETFRERQVAYILVEEPCGDIGVLIREKDVDRTKKAVRSTMKILAQSCTVMTGREAEMHYLRSNNEDKMMLQVAGLTWEELLYLTEAGGRVLQGEAVGMDLLSDGTFLFTCHGKTAMCSRGKKSFGGALTEAVLLMNGESSKAMRGKEKERAKYLKAKAEGFPDRHGLKDGPVWIVGNGNRYVKRGDGGFELGHAVTERGDVELVPDLYAGEVERRYEERLESALARITGHTCLYRREDVLDWFREKRGFFAGQAVAGQQHLAARADAMVTAKIENDRIMRMEGRWDIKLRHYISEMKDLLGTIRGGHLPEGYKKEDIEELKGIARAFGLDAEKMGHAISRVIAVDIYSRDAGPRKIHDVQRQIEKAAGGEGRDIERFHAGTKERTPGRGR